MAHRPIDQKKLQRLRKGLGRRSLPAYIDLIQWLLDRGHVNTAGAARRLLLEGKVMSESHVIGREKRLVRPAPNSEPKLVWVAAPLVPADLRPTIRVEA